MSESVIDFAGLDATAAVVDAPVVDSAVVDTPEVDAAETPGAGAELTEKPAVKEAKQKYNTDGSPKEEATKAEDLPGTEKAPQEIRKALKSFRDANPANIAAT